MKITVSSQYKKVFGEELLPLGFKLYKKTFYRVVGDVIQTLFLNNSDTMVDVEFNVLALCSGIKDLYCESMYSLAEAGQCSAWFACPVLDQNALDSMLRVFRTHVKPLFEECINSRCAYERLIQLSRKPGCSFAYDNVLAEFCLQSEEYEKALCHWTVIAEKWRESYPGMLERHQNALAEYGMDVLWERTLKEYHEIIELEQKLKEKDTAYLQRYVVQKQLISWETLKHPKYP